MVTAKLVIEVTPLSSATELVPASLGHEDATFEATFESPDFEAGHSRPTMEMDDATRRCLLATVGAGLGDVAELDGEDGPLAYADWDERTLFSQSAAVSSAVTLPAVSGLIVSTRELPADTPIYLSAAEGDMWAFVVGELEADRGTWHGREEE